MSAPSDTGPEPEASREHRDALVTEIGSLLLSDAGLAEKGWDAIALVATLADGRRNLQGYRYFDGDDFAGWVPSSFEPLRRIRALHEAMAKAEGEPWRQCLVQLRRDGPSIDIAFEYERADRWSLGEATLDTAAHAASLKP